VRLQLISCEIFFREMCAAVARSPHQIDVSFLPKGLHDIGAGPMLKRLQDVVDQVDSTRYDAVLLGYALCGMGIAGLVARSLPIVIPRAHDCITLYLGSKERYIEYFNSHPGVYFQTTGWMERGAGIDPSGQLPTQHLAGLTSTYQELVEKYGEDNAKFLFEELGDLTRNYGQFTFIEMGVEPDDRFERKAREEAAKRGWKFEKISGDMSLVRRFTDGEWNEEDFLVLQPGQRVAATNNDSILKAEPIP
jgi:hypothetical protein